MFTKAEPQWRIDLALEHGRLLERVTRLSAGGLSWENYLQAPELEDLQVLRRSLGTSLGVDHGISLLRIGQDMSDHAMRLLFLLLGRAMGRNVGPTTCDRPLFAITATDDPTIGGTYAGNGRNARALALHTDGSGIHSGRVDILGMLCIRAADKGGISRFADTRVVYRQLGDDDQQMLANSYPRIDPYNPYLSADRLVCRPIFEPVQAGLRFSYHPARVRDGIRLRDGGFVAPALEQAFANLDVMLEQSAVEFPLSRGDMIFLDNRVIAHGRTAFVDSCRPRWIERLWLEIEQ